MIGKKFIEGHNLGQKVNHAIHIGAKVATVGATIYGLHQAHKEHNYNEGLKHLTDMYNALPKQEYQHYGDVWAPGHKLNVGWSK